MTTSTATFDTLLADDRVEDIVLSPRGLSFFFAGRGWTGPVPSPMCERRELVPLARRIGEEAALTLGPTQPTCDAFLHWEGGGSFRAHVAISPLVFDGPEITLRRLPRFQFLELGRFAMAMEVGEKLRHAAETGKSILISGSTGSGKTSLLVALLKPVATHTRFLILEDSPEIPLPNELSAKLIARHNRFGFREGATWGLDALVFESLRMRPDRLILGECRGPEAFAIACALQTGHRGLMTTLHAGSVAGAMDRFDALANAHPQATAGAVNARSLWDIVIHLELRDGQRHVRELWEREP